MVPTTPLTIGTRGSRLALRQAERVVDAIHLHWPKWEVRTKVISSEGDLHPQIQPAELGDLAGKGIFTKALDEALLNKEIDLAIHSLKDLPLELVPGLQLIVILERADPRDVWISKDRQSLHQLRPGARIGTGSPRRSAQLKLLMPDCEILPLRGNIDTRIQRLKSSEHSQSDNEKMDGIVIALAGVSRAGLEKEITEILPFDQMLPAIGQGAIVLVNRDSDTEIAEQLKILDHEQSRTEIMVERAFLAKLGGGCHVPIAGVAQLRDGIVTLKGAIFKVDGTSSVKGTLSSHKTEGIEMAHRLAQMLLAQGGSKLLAGVKR